MLENHGTKCQGVMSQNCFVDLIILCCQNTTSSFNTHLEYVKEKSNQCDQLYFHLFIMRSAHVDWVYKPHSTRYFWSHLNSNNTWYLEKKKIKQIGLLLENIYIPVWTNGIKILLNVSLNLRFLRVSYIYICVCMYTKLSYHCVISLKSLNLYN